MPKLDDIVNDVRPHVFRLMAAGQFTAGAAIIATRAREAYEADQADRWPTIPPPAPGARIVKGFAVASDVTTVKR